jgi:glycosyltransferase involved in cell wall biosynthesis
LTSGSPVVSVITTVYNAQAVLETTLASLLAQTFRDFEAIIIDDGSEDGSVDIIQRLAATDVRIRFFRQQNQGFAAAVNCGLSEARGEFIAFLDHDDIWLPEKLQRQVERLREYPEAGLVNCYSALLDGDLRCTGWRFGSYVNGEAYRMMRFCDLVAGGSVPLVRRQFVEQAGGFDTSPELQGRTDWDYWLRLSRLCPFISVGTSPDATLVGYVRRPGNYSADYRRMLRAGVALLAKAARQDPELEGVTLQRAMARDAFGVFCLSLADGELKEAGHCLRQSLALSWAPVAFSPVRWGIVALYLLARVLPEKLYRLAWQTVARLMFGITPGAAFLQAQSGTKGRAGD